ncbi:MAG: hypothetical protein QOG58_661, partial [Caballeronia sp.]|nr:hypothetical protein [Caballeronia sp.]
MKVDHKYLRTGLLLLAGAAQIDRAIAQQVQDAPQPATLPPIQVHGAALSSYSPFGGDDTINDPKQVSAASKTGTKLEDLPSNA